MQTQDHRHTPVIHSAGATQDGQPARQAGAAVIPSERLLLGQPCVTIDHDGTHYVLRATRAGKLILTK